MTSPKRVGTSGGLLPTLQGEVPYPLFLGCEIFLFLALAILREIPLLFFLLFVHEPLGVVCELNDT